MNQTLNINTLIMFVFSLGLAYLSINLITPTGVTASYEWGFLFGRAVAGVLFPLVIVYLPLLLIRRGKPKFTKGTYITWWILFILLGAMAIMGSALEHAS